MSFYRKCYYKLDYTIMLVQYQVEMAFQVDGQDVRSSRFESLSEGGKGAMHTTIIGDRSSSDSNHSYLFHRNYERSIILHTATGVVIIA